MIQLELKRIAETPDSTAGILTHNGKFLAFTIEDGHRDIKEYGKTRIPAGTYEIFKRKDGGRFNSYSKIYGHKWIPQLKNVPNFVAIQIHIGNDADDSRGCILLNSTLGHWDKINQFIGHQSTEAYTRFYKYIESLNDDQIQITVK